MNMLSYSDVLVWRLCSTPTIIMQPTIMQIAQTIWIANLRTKACKADVANHNLARAIYWTTSLSLLIKVSCKLQKRDFARRAWSAIKIALCERIINITSSLWLKILHLYFNCYGLCLTFQWSCYWALSLITRHFYWMLTKFNSIVIHSTFIVRHRTFNTSIWSILKINEKYLFMINNSKV